MAAITVERQAELGKMSAPVRTQRAELRKDVAGLTYWDGREEVARILEAKLPPFLRTMVPYDLLRMIRQVSPERAVRFLIFADVPNIPVARLSYEDRGRLASALRGVELDDES